MKLPKEYANLSFTKEQLFLNDDEYLEIAKDFWGTASIKKEALTDRDRAFLQAALLIAVDKSEKSGMLFDVFASFVKSAPSQSLKKLVKSLAKKTAKRWFANYIDDDPKISAAGKAGIQNSAFTTEWKLRVGLRDDKELNNFLLAH